MRSTSMLSRLPILMNFFRAAELDGGSFSLGLCKIARSQREAFEARGTRQRRPRCAFKVSIKNGCCSSVILLSGGGPGGPGGRGARGGGAARGGGRGGGAK